MYNTAVDSEEFYDFMKDPSIPKLQKKPALESILQKLDAHDITQRFFSVPQPLSCCCLLALYHLCIAGSLSRADCRDQAAIWAGQMQRLLLPAHSWIPQWAPLSTYDALQRSAGVVLTMIRPDAGLLADNNRLGEFLSISDTFDEIMAAERGEIIATITTAQVSTHML